MTIVFGQFTTQFTDYSTDAGTTTSAQQFRANVNSFVLWYIYLFAAIFVVTYISSVTAALAAVRTVRNIRMVFLEKTLRQEVGHFDRHLSIGSISAQVTTSEWTCPKTSERHKLTNCRWYKNQLWYC